MVEGFRHIGGGDDGGKEDEEATADGLPSQPAREEDAGVHKYKAGSRAPALAGVVIFRRSTSNSTKKEARASSRRLSPPAPLSIS